MQTKTRKGDDGVAAERTISNCFTCLDRVRVRQARSAGASLVGLGYAWQHCILHHHNQPHVAAKATLRCASIAFDPHNDFHLADKAHDGFSRLSAMSPKIAVFQAGWPHSHGESIPTRSSPLLHARLHGNFFSFFFVFFFFLVFSAFLIFFLARSKNPLLTQRQEMQSVTWSNRHTVLIAALQPAVSARILVLQEPTIRKCSP